MLKNRKGISLTTMVITIIIMLIIMGTLVYSAVESVKVRKLNKLYNDLRQLSDAVEIYYLKNGELPINTSKKAIVIKKGDTNKKIENQNVSFVLKSGVSSISSQDDFLNPNDYVYASDGSTGEATYQYLKLDLLENISLNYNENEYIINTQSHTIYNYTGVTVNKKVYNALPLTYRDTKYNEKHPVNEIRLKSVEGITNGTSIYFGYSTEKLNIRDLLIFDTNTNDKLGEPKTLTFSTSDSDYYTLDSSKGILSRTSRTLGDGSENTLVDDSQDKYMTTITVYANSYGSSRQVNKTFSVYTSSLNVYTNPTEGSSTKVNNINLVTNPNKPTYVYKRNITGNTEYKVKRNGYLSVQNSSVIATSSDSDIATATYNDTSTPKLVVFKSGTKTGTADVTLEAQKYGFAKDTVTVNVFNFEIYAGSAGTNTNIDKLDFERVGISEKTNVILNVDGPEIEFDGTNNKVEWSIVKENGTTLDDSEVVVITRDLDSNKAISITPCKVGNTYLRCVVTIEGVKLEEMLIPITVVGGIESNDISQDYDISTDTITLTKASMNKETGTGAKIKYTFNDSELATSATYEATTSSEGFEIVTNGNTFVVYYNGTNTTTGIINVKAKVGDNEYTDTINIAVEDNS